MQLLTLYFITDTFVLLAWPITEVQFSSLVFSAYIVLAVWYFDMIDNKMPQK